LRDSIRGGELLARLQDFALGDLPDDELPTKNQLDVMRYLVDKVLPSLKDHAPVADPALAGGRPIVFQLTWSGAPMPEISFNQRPVIEVQPDGQESRQPDPE
jgi:hypothetical protein